MDLGGRGNRGRRTYADPDCQSSESESPHDDGGRVLRALPARDDADLVLAAAGSSRIPAHSAVGLRRRWVGHARREEADMIPGGIIGLILIIILLIIIF